MASDAVKDKPCPDCGSERRVIWNSPPMSRMAFEAGIHYGTGVDGGKYYGSQKALDNDLANRGLRRS